MAVAVLGGSLTFLALVGFIATGPALPVIHPTSSSLYRWAAVRDFLHSAYPIILLLTFILAFTIRSIVTASKVTDQDEREEPTTPTNVGPGGKPLPKKSPALSPREPEHQVLDFSRPRKLLFHWLSLATILTLAGNAVGHIAHALYELDEDWWCGKPAVVSPISRLTLFTSTDTLRSMS